MIIGITEIVEEMTEKDITAQQVIEEHDKEFRAAVTSIKPKNKAE